MVNYTTRESSSKLSPFSINSTTGEICVAGKLDYEDRRVYEIPVVATDTGIFTGAFFLLKELLNKNKENIHTGLNGQLCVGKCYCGNYRKFLFSQFSVKGTEKHYCYLLSSTPCVNFCNRFVYQSYFHGPSN